MRGIRLRPALTVLVRGPASTIDVSRKLQNAARVATVALVLATVHEEKFRARRSDKLAP